MGIKLRVGMLCKSILHLSDVTLMTIPVLFHHYFVFLECSIVLAPTFLVLSRDCLYVSFAVVRVPLLECLIFSHKHD